MKLVTDWMQCQDKQITSEFVDVHEQRGLSDCGLSLHYISVLWSGSSNSELHSESITIASS